MILLCLDTETGGLDPEQHSLLQLGYLIVDASTDEIIVQREFNIKNNPFNVTSEALSINNIDLQTCIEPKLKVMDTLLSDLLMFESPITILGHNVNFDIAFLKKFFKDCNVPYEKYISHRYIDTASFLMTLKSLGFPEFKTGSLGEAMSVLEIYSKERHTALADAIITWKVFCSLRTLLEDGWWTLNYEDDWNEDDLEDEENGW